MGPAEGENQVAPGDEGSNRTFVAFKKHRPDGSKAWLPTQTLWDSGNGSGRHVAFKF